jgi:OOP family OmpA-OmpF porin
VQGRAMLDQAIAAAKEDGTITSVTLTGNTDQLGNANQNVTLSLNRAIAVRDYLQTHGFPPVPINVQGVGSSNPKVQLSDCPASGQAQINCLADNRRVDITITRSVD